MVQLVSGVGRVQGGCPGVWAWPVGGVALPLLGIALHSLLNHQTLKKEQEGEMWPQACTPCFCCGHSGPSAAWRSSQGAQGSKAQVGSVSFMPLGVIVWTRNQY